MDGSRFDRIARSLASGVSRRAALGGVFAALAGGAVEAAAKPRRPRGCFGRSCGGGKKCCDGFTCCGGFCTNTRIDDRNCGGCGADCGDNGFCRRGACTCGGVRCGTACCDFEEACLDEAASTCGACPVGAGIEDPAAIVGCGASFEGFPECACVTSVDGIAACSSGYGFCVTCESDDQCSLAIGAQALCIPVGDACEKYGKQFACVEATCYGGFDVPLGQPRASLPGAGPYMRVLPGRRR